MTHYEKVFWNIVTEFTDLQQQKRPEAKSPWHDKEARGGDAMNQHQVAKRYQGRYTGEKEFKYSGELNSKIESIRSGASTMQVMTPADINYILKNYSIKELPKDKPKSIFAGVVIEWDPMKDTYILKSND